VSVSTRPVSVVGGGDDVVDPFSGSLESLAPPAGFGRSRAHEADPRMRTTTRRTAWRVKRERRYEPPT